MADNPYNPDTMRQAFARLQEQKAAIEKVSVPMREARDEFLSKCKAKEEELNAAIAKAEEGLSDICVQLATIARAVGSVRIEAEPAAAGGVAQEPRS